MFSYCVYGSSHPEEHGEKVILKISQNSQEDSNGIPFSKAVGFGQQRYFKEDSIAGVLLWILRNFVEQLILRTPLKPFIYKRCYVFLQLHEGGVPEKSTNSQCYCDFSQWSMVSSISNSSYCLGTVSATVFIWNHTSGWCKCER